MINKRRLATKDTERAIISIKLFEQKWNESNLIFFAKRIILVVLIFISFLPSLASAIDVGGIIDAECIWSLAGSPYTLTSRVQIAEDILLTIEPGVVIKGQGFDIEVFGTLKAVGNDACKVTFQDVGVYYAVRPGWITLPSINIQFCEFNHCKLLTNTSGGTLILSNSKIRDSRQELMCSASYATIESNTFIASTPENYFMIKIDSLRNDYYIEKNIFIGVDVTFTIRNHKVFIRNNAFYGDCTLTLAASEEYMDSVIFEYNSLLCTENIALLYPGSGYLPAMNNFWNTTDTRIIDTMIYDKNDDPDYGSPLGYVEYLPILIMPHLDTPILLPIANAGDDQIMDEGITVILNGSNSTDYSSTIASYRWTQTSGPSVVLANPNVVMTTFVAPPVEDNGIVITFQLMVENSVGRQDSDEISVIINDNGIKDFPDNVISISCTNKDNHIGIDVENGVIASLYAIDPDTITITKDKPENLIYGLLEMQIKVSALGGTSTVTIYLTASAPSEYKWYKYSTQKGWYDYSDYAEFNNDRTQVTITLIDGGIGDDDGIANGIINDPSGLGTSATNITDGNGGGGGGCFINNFLR